MSKPVLTAQTKLLDWYESLRKLQITEREAASPKPLSQDRESAYAEFFEKLWSEMTEEEQAEVRRIVHGPDTDREIPI